MPAGIQTMPIAGRNSPIHRKRQHPAFVDDRVDIVAWSAGLLKVRKSSGQRQIAPNSPARDAYFILPSRYSTCLRATGSYFRTTIFSVILREFFRVT